MSRFKGQEELPCFEIMVKEDDNSGIKMVSLVSEPAIETKGMFFSKDDEEKFIFDLFLTKQFQFEKVSFDFDDTLSLKKYQDIAKSLIEKGDDVHIVTRRRKSESEEVYKVAKELGIPESKVHFTEGKLKWDTIKKLGIEKHYDNNQNEVDKIKELTEAQAILALGDCKMESNFEFKSVKDQMKIVGPAMVPNKKIYRRDGDYEYFVTFSQDTIKKLVEKFNKQNNNRSINVDHSNQMVNGYIEQNWIIEDPIYDKSKLYGYNLPKGSWFIEVKIEDKEFWMQEVKEGGKYSFSVEGMLSMKPQYMSAQNIIDDLSDDEVLSLAKEVFAESYTDYPQAASENAKIALRWAEKNGWGSCGTPVGKARANQLANREPITRDTIARMAAFERHRQNSQKELGDGCGRLMWLAWGGDAGVEWAQRKLKQIDEQFAKIGERGAVVPSKKAPKSDTPNLNPKGEGTAKGDASTKRGAQVTERVENILKDKVTDFNERYKDKLGYGADIGMLKAVYQRGIGAFNVSHSPKVSSGEQWALARVNAFLYLLKNGRPDNPKYKNDNDLLPKNHPKREEKMMVQKFVEPSAGESQDEFISRCMGSDTMNNEYPDESQRAAVCYAYWDKK